jgi:integrase
MVGRFLKEERQKLIEAFPRHLGPIGVCALKTGMRRGEILSLRWDQVDLKNGFILLNKTKNGERLEIPINQTLRTALEELHQGTKA